MKKPELESTRNVKQTCGMKDKGLMETRQEMGEKKSGGIRMFVWILLA